MQQPQHWPDCDREIKAYVQGFVALVKEGLRENLHGVYLHGSLAMGCYYRPKSDLDLLATVKGPVCPADLRALALHIARYAQQRPTAGNIEFSLLTKEAAAAPIHPSPYLLHYSSHWHERILSDAVQYGECALDPDLSAHLRCTKQHGYCLYGAPIDEAIGEVPWDAFMAAVLDDLEWILDDENILESPYYGILNICRVLQLLMTGETRVYSKEEGALWALDALAPQYHPTINAALAIYRADMPVDEQNIKQGGIQWDTAALLAFRDMARTLQGQYESGG